MCWPVCCTSSLSRSVAQGLDTWWLGRGNVQPEPVAGVPGVHLTLPINFSLGWERLQPDQIRSQSFRMCFCPADCLAGHVQPEQSEMEWVTGNGNHRNKSIQVMCGRARMWRRRQGISLIIPCDNHIYDKSWIEDKRKNNLSRNSMSVSEDEAAHYLPPRISPPLGPRLSVCVSVRAHLATITQWCSLWERGHAAETLVFMPKSWDPNPSTPSHLTDKKLISRVSRQRDLQRQSLSCRFLFFLHIPRMCTDMCRQTKIWAISPPLPHHVFIPLNSCYMFKTGYFFIFTIGLYWMHSVYCLEG